MFLLIVFVEQVILQDYKHTSGSLWIIGDRNEHMGGGVNRKFLFPNNGIHTKIHLIVHNGFLYTSCIYKSLLILCFPIVHLKAYEYRVVATLVQGHHVDQDCVGFVRLTRW